MLMFKILLPPLEQPVPALLGADQMVSHQGIHVNSSQVGRIGINQRERVRSLCGAVLLSWDQSSKHRGGWILPQATLLGMVPCPALTCMTAVRMQGCGKPRKSKPMEIREQWSKLPSSSLLKAWVYWQEAETQIKLKTCKAGSGFPAGVFPCCASPVWTASLLSGLL